MLEILPSPDTVAAVAVSGTLTGGDYDRIIAEVEAKLARHERIGVLADLTRFEDFTAEAAWKDFRYDLSKLLELKRFPREAIISDKQWMRIAAAIADPILPHVEVRVFDPGDREEAMRWVAAF
jgi:hypothetical protein